MAEPAIAALTNLCADELPRVVEELLRRGIVDRLMEVRKGVCAFVYMYSMGIESAGMRYRTRIDRWACVYVCTWRVWVSVVLYVGVQV